jgi:hypothetical protein
VVLRKKKPLPEDGSPEPKHVRALNEIMFECFECVNILTLVSCALVDEVYIICKYRARK